MLIQRSLHGLALLRRLLALRFYQDLFRCVNDLVHCIIESFPLGLACYWRRRKGLHGSV